MSDYDRVDYGRSAERPWQRTLIVVLLVFAAGLLTMGWILTRWDAAAPYLTWMKPQPAAQVAAETAEPVTQFVVTPASDTRPLERRVAQLDSHVKDIAERAEAASGNANRAEALLVAFAARRAIDRGLQLGYLEGMLRNRFARSQPQAVATIITASRDAVTLEDLRGEFELLAPELTGVSPKADWWEAFKRELAGVVVVRREDTPTMTPDVRVERARISLNAGHVDRALAEIVRLPAQDKARNWIGNARRYVAAHNALDLIETSALLTPGRRLAPDSETAQP
ncbi:MAG: hypothetical protein AB7G25_04985 [Sphingomonadaceae bacterium]